MKKETPIIIKQRQQLREETRKKRFRCEHLSISDLQEIEILENRKKLGKGELSSIVETIEAAAFKGCSSLTTITFEKDSQLKIIGGGRDASASPVTYYGAFCSLKNLTTLDMSECTQVEEIGEGAFSNNSELQIFRIGTSIPPTCDNNTFYHINSNSVLKVPSGCINAYKAASGWKNFASITGLDE